MVPAGAPETVPVTVVNTSQPPVTPTVAANGVIQCGDSSAQKDARQGTQLRGFAIAFEAGQ